MTKFSSSFYLIGLLFLFTQNCSSQPPTAVKKAAVQKFVIQKEVKNEKIEKEKPLNLPQIDREFRGVWIATVANINWPSKNNLSTAQQKAEAITLLDLIAANNFNAVIFQARPSSDALYKSNIEPWSFFLTGEVGKAPNPYYDPLEFWITEAHKRGMELHVWLNPFRAHHTTGGKISSESMTKKMPDEVVKLANGTYWMDPSNDKTQDHVSAIVKDLVKRYDVDGVHFDDYFYPYKSYNDGKDFPDSERYAKYLKEGGNLSVDDWRRNSVNVFVKRVYEEIKAEKPEVKFGLSPFGIWRPGHPKSIAGMDQYEELYADAKFWLNQGWIDYFTPQLYWKINQTAQSFPVLLGWWESENTKGRHLWPGINIDFGGGSDNIDETINQIMITRGIVPEGSGTVHWSIGPLLKYQNLSKALLNGPYKKQALVPATSWLDDTAPETPIVSTKITNNELQVSWTHPHLDDVFKWVLFFKYDQGWEYKILDRTQNLAEVSFHLLNNEKENPLTAVGVTAIDKTGNQSLFEEIKIKLK